MERRLDDPTDARGGGHLLVACLSCGALLACFVLAALQISALP